MENTFKVEFLPGATEDLRKIDKTIGQRILNKIKWLSKNFPYITPQPLKGELKHMYKLRVGDWRILYTADILKKIIHIHMIGHRSDVYK